MDQEDERQETEESKDDGRKSLWSAFSCFGKRRKKSDAIKQQPQSQSQPQPKPREPVTIKTIEEVKDTRKDTEPLEEEKLGSETKD